MTDTQRPGDRPSVPRARRSIFAMILAGFAVLVVGGYSALAFTQRELGSGPERDEIPGDVKASPGGYRSFHFWHSGYHGGK
jgi:hypothetical protein